MHTALTALLLALTTALCASSECHFIPNHLSAPEITPKRTSFHVKMQRLGKASMTTKRSRYATGASINWSGYAAAPNILSRTNGVANYVYAQWTAPTVTATPKNGYTAAWVGFDGYFPTSQTVEQLGTEHDWYNGAAYHYAWIEMYPGPSVTLNPSRYPVRPGDRIVAEVVYAGNSQYVLAMENLTARWIAEFVERQPSAQRSSVEWIVEAPYENGILPLSNFGTIQFTNCQAQLNNFIGPINNTKWQNEQLTMVSETSPYPVKTSPQALTANGTAFSVIYREQGP